MNRRGKRLIALAGVLLLGAASVWLAAGTLRRGRAGAGQFLRHEEWEALVDEKAKHVAGGDERAVRELVDAVFRSPQLYGLPSLVAAPFKERLARAEVKYRRGARAGLTEETVVRVFDELARRLDAPEYARADAGEVNAMRHWLASSMPHLVPRLPAGPGVRPATFFLRAPQFAVGETMSPVEATLAALALIQQKELNDLFLLTRAERDRIAATLRGLDEKYSLTPEERFAVGYELVQQTANPAAAVRHTPEELAALAKRATAERGGRPPEARLGARVASPRAAEMMAVARRARSLGLFQGVRTAHEMLDLLGFER